MESGYLQQHQMRVITVTIPKTSLRPKKMMMFGLGENPLLSGKTNNCFKQVLLPVKTIECRQLEKKATFGIHSEVEFNNRFR